MIKIAPSVMCMDLLALGAQIHQLDSMGVDMYHFDVTKMHVVLAYVISGVCAGLAGMVNIARLGAAEPNAGTGYETFAVAAVVIGGTSFFGGQGLIPKVVLGGIIIGAINNGLNMIGVSSYYQQITMGAMIIATVTLDRFFGASGKLRK